jgi:hypothetical protein
LGAADYVLPLNNIQEKVIHLVNEQK